MMTEDRKWAAQQAVVARILEGDGTATSAQRRSAFENTGLGEPLRTLIGKVALQPTRITDADMSAVIASGLSEDQVFELVVCAAVGQSARQYEAGLRALSAITGDERAS